MGIVKKILYFLRLFTALTIFVLIILSAYSYISGNNFLNLPFDEIKNYIIKDPYTLLLKGMLFLAVVTLIFGRIWCSLLCPAGTFQEIIWLISRRANEKRPSYFYKYILLLITILLLYFFNNQITNFILGHIKLIIWSSVISLVLIGILTVFKGRFFCTDICPLGAFYGLISKFSIFRIHQGDNCVYCTMCEEVCPSGCIDISEEKVNNVTCVKCLRCFNACNSNGMNYGIKIPFKR